jgi:hypothetical protein
VQVFELRQCGLIAKATFMGLVGDLPYWKSSFAPAPHAAM